MLTNIALKVEKILEYGIYSHSYITVRQKDLTVLQKCLSLSRHYFHKIHTPLASVLHQHTIIQTV
jgi:hypothetical protein